MSKIPKIIVMVGPTSSGKSALAVNIAKKFSGAVISADSRQVYKGLDIGTGKITKKEMLGIPHYMLDIIDPKKNYSASNFSKDASEFVRYIVQKGKVPIVCGGTGFYISTLLGEVALTDVPPNPKLRKSLTKKSTDQLVIILKKLDPMRLKTIDQKNPIRLIRAIEIAKAGGKIARSEKLRPRFDTLKIGLVLEKGNLRKKIQKRLLKRLKQGMIEEAKHLHKKGLSWKRMEELGLEYRYLAKFLKGEISREEMVKKLQTEIWRYAKRQLTWFKKDKKIKWFNPKETKKIEKIIRKFLKK